MKYYHIFADILFLVGFIIPYWRLKKGELRPERKVNSRRNEHEGESENRKTTSMKARTTSRHVLYAVGTILVVFLLLTGVFAGIMKGIIELPVEKKTMASEETEVTKIIDFRKYDMVHEGHWFISDRVDIRDKVILLNGSLIVEAGGELILDNVTWVMGFVEEGFHSIGVQEGGALNVYNSLFTARHTETEIAGDDWWDSFDGSFYRFLVHGKMELVNSKVSYTRVMQLNSDDVYIENSEITMSEDDGIICEMCSPIINGSRITYQKEGSAIRCINSPAIITNNIIDQTSREVDGIYVDGYFPIMSNNDISNCDAGIRLENCVDITIANKTILNCDYGIYLEDCTDVILMNNTLENTGTGIRMGGGWSCSNITITKNEVRNSSYGISFDDLNGGIVENNILWMNNGAGISIGWSENVGIINNTIARNERGISCRDSKSLMITNNSFDHNSCTIYCEDSNVIFSNCTVTGTENFCIISEDSFLSVNNSRIERSFANISEVYDWYYYGRDDSTLTINQTSSIVFTDIHGGPVYNASISMKDPQTDKLVFQGNTDENGTILATILETYDSSSTVDTGVEYPLEIQTNDTIEKTAIRIDGNEDIEIISGVHKDIILHSEDIEIMRNDADTYEITINAMIRNQGSSAAHNVSVVFYADEVAIGSLLLDGIEMNSSQITTMKCFLEPGLHRVRVVCDPDNTIMETLESNNMGYGEISLNWTVTGEENYSDCTIILESNLIIESGGKLTLNNVDLAVKESYYDRFSIFVSEGGELHARDSVIASVHSGQYYDFKVYGKVALERCVLKGMAGKVYWGYYYKNYGWRRNITGGMEIFSDDVAVSNCTVKDFEEVGIYCNNSSPYLYGNTFMGGRNSLAMNNSSSTVFQNHFNADSSIMIYDSSPTILDNGFLSESWLDISGSDIIIERNRFSGENGWRSINSERSNVTIVENIFSNYSFAISCDNGDVTLLKNTFRDNRYVVYNHNSTSFILDNNFSNNYADIIFYRGSTHIENNTFTNTKGVSITLENSSSFIKNNYIAGDPGLSGIIVSDDSPVEMIDNDINGFLMGISITDSSGVDISNCKITDCLIGVFPSNSTVTIDNTDVHADMYKLMPFDGSTVELSDTNIGQEDILTLTDFETIIKYDGYAIRKTHSEKFFVSAEFSILMIIILFLLAFYDSADHCRGSHKRSREKQKEHSSTPGNVLLFSGITALIVGLFINPFFSEKWHFIGSMISPYISRIISPVMLFCGCTAIVMWRIHRKRRAPGHLIMGSAALLGISFSALAVLELVDVRPRYPFVVLSIVFFLLGSYPIISTMRKRRPNIRSFVPYLDIWMLGWGLIAVWLSFNFFSLYFFSEPADELIVAKDIILYGSILGSIGAISVAMAMLKQRLGRMVYTVINVAAMVGFFVVIAILPESICMFLSL